MSRPMKIGHHEWRINVRDFDICGKVQTGTEYQWRKDNGPWQSAREWPAYDHNDTFNGLPRSLSKLYKANKAAVDLFIHGKEPDQFPLL